METRAERAGCWALGVGRWLLNEKSKVQGLKSKVFRRRRAAFTLMELLVVLAIIGILIGLLFPTLMGARERAKISRARGEVQQLQQAWLAYWLTYKVWPTVGPIQMTPQNVDILAGNNPQKIAFMDFDERHLAYGFLDPWWDGDSAKLALHQYVVELNKQTVTKTWAYQTRVHCMNGARNQY